MIAKAFRINALLEAIRGGVAIVGGNFSLVVFATVTHLPLRDI